MRNAGSLDEGPKHHECGGTQPLGVRDDGAVSEKRRKVEVTMSDAHDPVTEALARNAGTVGGRGHGGPALPKPEGTEDVRHPVDLAGQHIAGKNPLAGLAGDTPREDDGQPHIPAG